MANYMPNFDLDGMVGKKWKDFLGQVDKLINDMGLNLLLFLLWASTNSAFNGTLTIM